MDERDWAETYFQQDYHERIQYELYITLNEVSIEDIWRVREEFPFVRLDQLVQLKSFMGM